jgi:hypothetical protein
MKIVLYSIIISTLITGFNLAQTAPTIELVEGYNSWGWDAWVMQNDFITVAIMPEIGARVMKYDLGSHSSIYVNPSELGNTYTPSLAAPARNFGGFKNWPAPQANWNWPPPPTLDYGLYTATADTFIDSVRLTVTSPVEQWRAPDIRFQRRTTLYKGTSRVKVEQTIINEGNEEQHWSVWDVTQSYTTHENLTDFEFFWVYFPINPQSLYGESGVRIDLNNSSDTSDAWVGEIAPGIYGVQYSPDAQKIFADSHIGWICYVDELNGYAYAKTFDIDEVAEYPDEGARIAVWVQNYPFYLEVEVMSPVVDLPAQGGSYTFIEDWWAAKVNGPILSVNSTGAVKSFEYDIDNERFNGEFGVFFIGKARLEFTDITGVVLDSSDTYDVTPLETFILDDTTAIPGSADSVQVVLLDNANHRIGILVSKSVSEMITGIKQLNSNQSTGFELKQNYPNPFNPETSIRYSIPQAGKVNIILYNVLGQKVRILFDDYQPAGSYIYDFFVGDLPSGVYFYQIQAGEFSQVKKMVLMK